MRVLCRRCVALLATGPGSHSSVASPLVDPLGPSSVTARRDGNYAPNRAAKVFTHILCSFGMMRATFGPALPATHRSGPVVVFAAKTRPDFVREVSEGTRYVGEKYGRTPPISWQL